MNRKIGIVVCLFLANCKITFVDYVAITLTDKQRHCIAHALNIPLSSLPPPVRVPLGGSFFNRQDIKKCICQDSHLPGVDKDTKVACLQ